MPILVLLAAVGCAESGRRGDTGTPDLPAAATGDATLTPAADSLDVRLVVAPVARVGETIPLTLEVTNRTERPIDLYLRGRTATLDVTVIRLSGEPLWRRLEGDVIPAIVHLRTLAPAERLELVTVWDQKAKDGRRATAGDYLVQGHLLTEGAPLSAPPVPLRIGL